MRQQAEQGAKVISLRGARPKQGFPVVEEVEAYWHGLRAGSGVPYRAHIDPRGIERALGNAFILERIAPGVGRFRLAGQHLCDLMGMEVRGMPLTALFTPDARPAIADSLASVLDAPQCTRLYLSAPAAVGRPALSAEMTLLPLRNDSGEVARVLGCLAAEGRIGRAPRRFEIVDEVIAPIPDAALTLPPGTGAFDQEAGFAEPAADFEPADRADERPALRLVKTDAAAGN